MILKDIKDYNGTVFENGQIAKARGEAIAARLQRHASWYDNEFLEPYRQASELMQNAFAASSGGDQTQKHPVVVLCKILPKFTKREMSKNLLENDPRQLILPN
jgi:hypothetical protein